MKDMQVISYLFEDDQEYKESPSPIKGNS